MQSQDGSRQNEIRQHLLPNETLFAKRNAARSYGIETTSKGYYVARSIITLKRVRE